MQISLGTTNNQATFFHFRECAKYLGYVGHFRAAGKEQRQTAGCSGNPFQAQPCPRQNGWALLQGALGVLEGFQAITHLPCCPEGLTGHHEPSFLPLD